MKMIKQGQIIFTNFDPSFGHEYRKARPALVISSDSLLKKSNLITCLPLTKKIRRVNKASDVLVEKSSKNRLFSNSVIKTQHICTFDKRRCLNFIGSLEKELLRVVKSKLIQNLGLF